LSIGNWLDDHVIIFNQTKGKSESFDVIKIVEITKCNRLQAFLDSYSPAYSVRIATRSVGQEIEEERQSI